ncbi:hypothetical protein MUP77_17400 [Candidatus Bathyarchaeota archaeon]|nr:hypothetical protein [Candidatus Bathyarchaeota archaeon]
MSTRKDIGRTKKFCQAIPEQLADENGAVGIYNSKAAEARKLNHPGSEEIAIIYEKLAADEASHADALRKLARNVCPL